jgi:hypothetical protein
MLGGFTIAAGSADVASASVARPAAHAADSVSACPNNGGPTRAANGTGPCIHTDAAKQNQTVHDSAVACAKKDKYPLTALPGGTVGCDASTSKTTTLSVSDSFETALGTVGLSVTQSYGFSVGGFASEQVPKSWTTLGKAGWELVRDVYDVTQKEIECTAWAFDPTAQTYYCPSGNLKTVKTLSFKAYKPSSLLVVAMHAGPIPKKLTPHAIPGPSGSANGSFVNAFQAAGEDTVWASDPNGDAGDSEEVMADGTSPSITVVTGGYEIAFQSDTNQLTLIGSDGNLSTGLGMMPGTSPSIHGLLGGGYEVAFQSSTGDLWVYGTLGTADLGYGMANNSSPALTVINSGYEVAFEANTGVMWTTGIAGTVNFGAAGVMMPGTSPAITGLWSGGYETAFQNSQGDLVTLGNHDWTTWNLGMDAGSSPAITVAGDGYEVAVQTNTNDLWTVGAAGEHDWQLGMMPGSSPAIGSVDGGGSAYEIAIQANNGNLWDAGSDGTGGNILGIETGTNPSIATG